MKGILHVQQQDAGGAFDLRTKFDVAGFPPADPDCRVARPACTGRNSTSNMVACRCQSCRRPPAGQKSSNSGLLDGKMAPDPMPRRRIDELRRSNQADILLPWTAAVEAAGHRVRINGAVRLPRQSLNRAAWRAG